MCECVSEPYLRHLRSFITRDFAGLTARGGLHACEDYWQYAAAKQLWKANNCLKVNNNAVLSGRVLMGWTVGGISVDINQIEFISRPAFHLLDVCMKRAALGLYSRLMHKNARQEGDFGERRRN